MGHYHLSSACVKMHSFGNWGMTIDNDVKKHNLNLYQNGVVSIFYNYFGFTLFCEFLDEWVQEGLVSKGL